MSLLKQVSVRLKSVRNIQKITKSMEMVSASKFARAERELVSARPFGFGPRKFYETSKLMKKLVSSESTDKKKRGTPGPIQAQPEVVDEPTVKSAEKKKVKRLYIAMTSDRGLCGGVHSSIVRRIKQVFTARGATQQNHKLVCVGEKSRVVFSRSNPENLLLSANDVGKTAPVFADASVLAAGITEAGFEFDIAEIYYNKYHNPAKYELMIMPIFTKIGIESAPNISAFDEVDGDMLDSYVEWTLAALLYFAMKEGAASEQSARMMAMTNATKNAEEMIRKLNVMFNRTRQAVITRELIEIISGAAALK